MNVRAFAAVGIVLLLGMVQLSYGGTEQGSWAVEV